MIIFLSVALLGPYLVAPSCLDCYRGIERCLLDGQCVPEDPKFLTVDALKRLIFRDCPVRNAGPCPKKACPVCPQPELCICPDTNCNSTCPLSDTTTTLPCICPEAPEPTPCPTSTTSACPPCPTPTVDTVCPTALGECQKSLYFTDLSKGGAQGERKTWKEEAERLVIELNTTETRCDNYREQRNVLVQEVKNCTTERDSLFVDWGLTNATLSDLESMHDNRTVDLVECRGNLSLALFSNETCQRQLMEAKGNESGIT